MATREERRQQRRENLQELASLTGIYNSFSPEAQARELLTQQQAIAAQYQNDPLVRKREEQMRDIGLRNAQLTFEREQARSKYDMQRLMTELEDQQLRNAALAGSLPYQPQLEDLKIKTAAADLEERKARQYQLAQLAPYVLQKSDIENRTAQASLDALPKMKEYNNIIAAQKAQSQGMAQQFQVADKMAELNKAFNINGLPENNLFTREQVLNAISGRMVNQDAIPQSFAPSSGASAMYGQPAAENPSVSVAPFLNRVAGGMVSPDKIPSALGAVDATSPNRETLIDQLRAAIIANPNMPLPPEIQDLIRQGIIRL